MNNNNVQDILAQIAKDISEIDSVLQYKNYDQMKEVHMELDGKYQAAIKDWPLSMYGYVPKYGFSYGAISHDSMMDNLKLMRAKLESYKLGLNSQKSTNVENNEVSVVVNNTNSINIEISFDEARSSIENMPGLTHEQTEEILKRIDGLETINSENENKKKKWEKVKPILKFAIDKGVDVAMVIMELVAKMNMN